MTTKEHPLITKLKALNVGYDYIWDMVDDDEIKYSFDGVATNMNFEQCTLSQLLKVIILIFDVGYGGKFYCNSNDFYGHFRAYVERCLLDKLLVNHRTVDCELVAKTLSILDKWYDEG